MTLTFIPPTARKGMTKARATRIFLAANGICFLCGGQIRGEAYEIEHPNPLALGGSDDDAGLRPVHVKCHAVKTRADKGAIARRNRIITQGWTGKAKRPFPGSRRDKWRKRIDGTVIPR